MKIAIPFLSLSRNGSGRGRAYRSAQTERNWPAQIIGWIATIAVLVIGGWMFVQLAWRWVLPTPSPYVSINKNPVKIASDIVDRSPYGVLRKKQIATTKAKESVFIGNYELVGIIASKRKAPGYAILREKNGTKKQIVLATGDELKGLKLLNVNQNNVEFLREGAKSKLTLIKPSKNQGQQRNTSTSRGKRQSTRDSPRSFRDRGESSQRKSNNKDVKKGSKEKKSR